MERELVSLMCFVVTLEMFFSAFGGLSSPSLSDTFQSGCDDFNVQFIAFQKSSRYCHYKI